MALGTDPKLARAVGADAGETCMRLDVALVRRLGLEDALDDVVGLLETRVWVAMAELVPARDVRGLLWRGLDAFRDHVAVQDRRTWLHRLVDVGNVREDLVLHIDQLERLARNGGAGGGDRRDRVSVIERLLPRHHVV